MIGDLISGASKLIGGWMSQESAKDAQASQLALQQNEYERQKEFAQHGIQWKISDALNAGVHPLAALGASTTSYAAQAIGAPESGHLGKALSDAGADIGRAVNATLPANARAGAATKAAEALTLERGALENELLRTQIASQSAKLNQAGGNPAMPVDDKKYLIPGQGPTVEVTPIDEAKKYKDRPKMVIGGRRILTDPATSNVESAEDRYGDEGPAQWLMQAATAWQDLKHNINQGNLTRQDVAEWASRQLKWIDKNTKIFGR